MIYYCLTDILLCICFFIDLVVFLLDKSSKLLNLNKILEIDFKNINLFCSKYLFCICTLCGKDWWILCLSFSVSFLIRVLIYSIIFLHLYSYYSNSDSQGVHLALVWPTRERAAFYRSLSFVQKQDKSQLIKYQKDLVALLGKRDAFFFPVAINLEGYELIVTVWTSWWKKIYPKTEL